MNIIAFIAGIAAVGILFVTSIKGDFFSIGFLNLLVSLFIFLVLQHILEWI
jgi:hypothetical protein